MIISVMIAALGALFTFTIFYIYIKKCHQYWAEMGLTQLKPNLLFGDLGPIFTGKKSMHDFFMELYQTAKAAGHKHVGIYNTFSPEYVPIDLNEIKLMLTRDFDYFNSHGLYHSDFDPLSMNLFALDGEKWRQRRHTFSPMFSPSKVRLMYDTLANNLTGVQKVVQQHIDEKQAIDIQDLSARFATDVTATTVFGVKCDTLDISYHKLREIGRLAFKPRAKKFILEAILPSDFIAKLGYRNNLHEVRSYFTNFVKDVVINREKSDIRRMDLFHVMKQLRNSTEELDKSQNDSDVLTEDEMIAELFLFYTAGFEISSTATSMILFELSRNHEIQKKLRENILDTLSKHNGELSFNCLMEMDYLDKVVKETLRMYPVVSPTLFRKCTKDYKVPNSNVVIKNGTKIHIPVSGIQRDPEFYPNPEKFNPENFSSDNKGTRPKLAWLPFGEGPRQCIGFRFGMAQIKILVAALIKDFEFTLDESMQEPFESEKFTVIYMFTKPIMLKATKL